MKSTLALALLLTLSLASEAAAQTSVVLDPVLSGLSSPVYLTNARDGSNRLFVVEQPGRIKLLRPGASAPSVFLDITSRVLAGGERGLLGLAFHPQYTTNRRFFVNYTRRGDGATVIAEYRASAANPDLAETAEAVILVIPQPFENHNGGMIEFGRDGFLYVGMGDGGSGNDPGNRAQNVEDLLGKMLRIDVDLPNGTIPYSSPPDNPFFGSTPGRDEIYATGFRNPFRWSFDRATGQLWAGDVGQGAREEIDLVNKGGNYGWRVFEGTSCTGLGPAPCTPANYVAPVTEYTHASGRCSVTGGYVYRGTQRALPAGAYLYADFCTGEIFMYQGATPTQPLVDTAINISSFGEDEAGELYVVGLGGTVHRIRNPNPPNDSETVWVEDSLPTGAAPFSNGESWSWVGANPTPFSGTLAHQSAVASGFHNHYFQSATQTLSVSTGEVLFTYVYIDPANVPAELMLQWHDGTAWRNAYWGADNISWVGPRVRIGDVPASGQWVRLEVPASLLGLEGKTVSGMAFNLWGGRATWDRAGKAVPPPADQVWVEDALPSGALAASNNEPWEWASSNPAPHSGSLWHRSASVPGFHNHYFHSAFQTLSVAPGDRLYAYVYLDAADLPTELMLQWNDGTNWRNAYWGNDQITWVGARTRIGDVPASGQWVKLEVPASTLGLEGKTLTGMAFNLWGGRAAWDRAGRLASTTPPPAAGVWVEDGLPAGAVTASNNEQWTWVSSNPAPFSGTSAHQSALVTGFHNHYFHSATQTLSVNTGDRLYAYVYIDPGNVPTELMLQWNDGTQWRNAYWGADNINWVGPRTRIGDVPAAGQWTRLEVPAATLGLEGKTLTGMAFNLWNGRVTWDKAGKDQ